MRLIPTITAIAALALAGTMPALAEAPLGVASPGRSDDADAFQVLDAPQRVLDTRDDASTADGELVGGGPTEEGFVTVYPCGEDRPNASNLNVGVGGTIAVGALVRPGDDGRVCVNTTAVADLLVDVSGTSPRTASTR